MKWFAWMILSVQAVAIVALGMSVRRLTRQLAHQTRRLQHVIDTLGRHVATRDLVVPPISGETVDPALDRRPLEDQLSELDARDPDSTPPSAVPSAHDDAVDPQLDDMAAGVVTSASLTTEQSLLRVGGLVGALLLLVGMLFGLGLAIESGAVTPGMLVAGGLLIGGSVWVGGAVLTHHKVSNTGAMLSGLGAAGVILTLLAGSMDDQLLGEGAAAAGMLGVLLGSLAHALVLRQRVMAYVGLMAAGLTSVMFGWLLPDGIAHHVMVGVVMAGMVWLADRMRWADVLVGTGVVGAVTYGAWFGSSADDGTMGGSWLLATCLALPGLWLMSRGDRPAPVRTVGTLLVLGLYGLACVLQLVGPSIADAPPFEGSVGQLMGQAMAHASGVDGVHGAFLDLSLTWTMLALAGLGATWFRLPLATFAAFAGAVCSVAMLQTSIASPHVAAYMALPLTVSVGSLVGVPLWGRWWAADSERVWAMTAVVPLGLWWAVDTAVVSSFGTDGRPVYLAICAGAAAGVAWALHRHHSLSANAVPVSAWSTVAALFGLSILPAVLEQEWLTISFALVALAMAALARRTASVLLWWGAVVVSTLVAVRLLVNPAALTYGSASGVAVLNWTLYTWGIPALAAAWTARELARFRDGDLTAQQASSVALVEAYAALLGFALINVQVSHAYQFDDQLQLLGDDWAAGTVRSLAWAGYGLVLLGGGVVRDHGRARLAGFGFLMLGAFKVFAYDLWSLSGLARVGSLIGMGASLVFAAYVFERLVLRRQAADGPEGPAEEE